MSIEEDDKENGINNPPVEREPTIATNNSYVSDRTGTEDYTSSDEELDSYTETESEESDSEDSESEKSEAEQETETNQGINGFISRYQRNF